MVHGAGASIYAGLAVLAQNNKTNRKQAKVSKYAASRVLSQKTHGSIVEPMVPPPNCFQNCNSSTPINTLRRVFLCVLAHVIMARPTQTNNNYAQTKYLCVYVLTLSIRFRIILHIATTNTKPKRASTAMEPKERS